MKSTKLLLGTIATLAFFIFAMSGFGQSKYKEYKDCKPEEKAKIIVENLTPVLNLDNEQYSRIYNLYLDRIRWKSVNEVAGVKNNKSINRKKYEEFKSNLKNVLTEKQQVNMKLYCESRKKNK
jgi:hypothetical protein